MGKMARPREVLFRVRRVVAQEAAAHPEVELSDDYIQRWSGSTSISVPLHGVEDYVGVCQLPGRGSCCKRPDAAFANG